MYVPLGSRAVHAESCDYVPVACPNPGCGAVVSRRDSTFHALQCPYRVVSCPLCSATLCASSLASHEASCPESAVECPCGASVKRSALEAHKRASCAAALVPCPCAGCPCSVPRGDVARHLSENSATHIPFIVDELAARDRDIRALHAEIRCLRDQLGGPRRFRGPACPSAGPPQQTVRWLASLDEASSDKGAVSPAFATATGLSFQARLRARGADVAIHLRPDYGELPEHRVFEGSVTVELVGSSSEAPKLPVLRLESAAGGKSEPEGGAGEKTGWLERPSKWRGWPKIGIAPEALQHFADGRGRVRVVVRVVDASWI
eukprot:m51a1_g5178 hypothetical protein (319) ;mRNA; r:158517-159473